MFSRTPLMFEGKWSFMHEWMRSTLKRTSWMTCDLEALVEHAIVHVMRHRLQLEMLLARSGA